MTPSLPPEPYDPPHTWRYNAKCRDLDVDTEMYYPPRDRDLYTPIAGYAKAVCTGKDGLGPCPVRYYCLLEGLTEDEDHGIWGGMSHRERNAFLRRKTREAPDMSLEEWVWKATKGR